MRSKNPLSISDPRELLAQQLLASGTGSVSNVGEGINKAASSLAGGFLARNIRKDNEKQQQDYAQELGRLSMFNSEAGGNNDTLIQSMLKSPNRYVREMGSQAYGEMMASQLKPQNPISVGAGGTVIDPSTGKVIFSSPHAPLGGGGGQIGYIYDKIKAEHPDWSDTQILYAAQTGWRQGLDKLPDGRVSPTAGVPQSKQAIKYAEATGGNLSDLEYKPQIAVATKKAEAKADADIADAKAEPLIHNLLDLNNATFDTPYAGAINPIARSIPGTDEQTTAMDLMQQARIEIAAPLAKQLGVNPTDKDFQASLDRIFNPNSTKASREAQIRALGNRIAERKAGGDPASNNQIDYKSKYGLQ